MAFTKTSERGLKLITQREGKILHVYKDSQGYPTAGVGHLLTASEKRQFPVHTPITEKQCQDWLITDLKECESAVNGIGVKLGQNEFDALVSLSFNIGVGGFNRSTVVRRLKAGNHKGAAEAILLWNKPPEIQGRRRGEYHQFLTPYISAVASTNGDPTAPDGQALAGSPTLLSEGNPGPIEQPPIVQAGATETAVSTATTTTQTTGTPPDTTQTTTTTTDSPPVAVVPATPTLQATAMAFFAMVYGYYKIAKEDFGNLLDKATSAIDMHIAINLGIGASLVIVGMWLHNRSRDRAASVTQSLIKSAADQRSNTVTLVSKPHWWSRWL